jgi:hypothetical protein
VTIPSVLAHGLVGRADLPLPLGVFVGAAAAVLAVSFAGLAAGWTRPRLEQPRERPLFHVPLVVDVVCGLFGIALFSLAVYAGFAGSRSPSQNLLPTLIYIVLWVAVPMASLLAGDVFRLFSPWRAVGRAVGWVAARIGGEEATEALPYPERLGRWPAAAGIALFAAVELCWRKGDDPRALAILAVAYFALQLAGQGIYGVQAWSRDGDAFGVYFSLFARLSAFRRDSARRLVVRMPGSGAVTLERTAGTVAVLVAAIGATTFDGAKEGSLLGSAFPHLQDAFSEAGLSKGAALEIAFLLGLVFTLAFVAAIYALGARRDARPLVHSLLPIAAAYVVAHYFSLAAYNLQSVPALLSDPLGEGKDWFGWAATRIDYGVVSATAIWWVQVAALVTGHVGALVLAHDRALALHGTSRGAARSQFAMLAVMVAFTCIGLWQLSVANQ